MKMSAIVVAAFVSVATLAWAAEAPESVVLPAKNGNITLNHKSHGNMTSCSTCHGETIGKFLPMTKEKGHAMCLDCHKTGGQGPTKCGDCHKK